MTIMGRDQVIRLWRFDRARPLARALQVVGQAAKAVAFSPDGKLLAAGDDAGLVEIWEPDTHKALIALESQGDAVWALDFSPQAHLLASGDRSGRIHF